MRQADTTDRSGKILIDSQPAIISQPVVITHVLWQWIYVRHQSASHRLLSLSLSLSLSVTDSTRSRDTLPARRPPPPPPPPYDVIKHGGRLLMKRWRVVIAIIVIRVHLTCHVTRPVPARQPLAVSWQRGGAAWLDRRRA